MKFKLDREMFSLIGIKIEVGNGYCCIFVWFFGFLRIFIYLISKIKVCVF